jgi:adenylate cyclase
MEYQEDNQLVKRIAKLVQENKELSQELYNLRKKYDDLLKKNDEYAQIINRVSNFKEIKETVLAEKSKTFRFNMATVLYAQIHGFSDISPEMDSHVMMDQLDHLYYHFDKIVKKYPIEKIRTIGDTYMCAGGIPEKNITNPVEVVLAANEMLQLLKSYASEHNTVWKICIAVHTGPVTSMLNGKNKNSYDIKGETVNVATRMEASGSSGKLLISVMTYELIKEFFDCDYHGKLPVKYKGDLEMYIVKGIKPELSVDGLGTVPNQKFNTNFALIQFHDLQEQILDILEFELPQGLFYHNLKHTVDVVTEVELIGWAEGISDEDILLLKTAALFHDAGHIVEYRTHELHGTHLARKILPKYNYTSEQIDKICEIILATKMPPAPKNLLEEIICDADLDYLGRIDFIPVSNTLYEELKLRNMIGSMNDWNKAQLEFISNHQYFTKTARQLREVNKQQQIERIRQLIT